MDDRPNYKPTHGKIVIITGTPGVGKSSVSELFASRVNARLISLGELVEKEKLYSGVDRKRDTLIADIEKVSKRLGEITADYAGDLVIEGHFAADTVPTEKISFVFVLRRDPDELRNILGERGYREEKVRENLAAEILDVCLYDAVKRCGVEKVCEVDVTGRRVEDVVEEVFLIFNGNKKCRIGLVDWLGKLESEGRLEEYLENL